MKKLQHRLDLAIFDKASLDDELEVARSEVIEANKIADTKVAQFRIDVEVVSVQATPATSQARGDAQTPAARSPEQVVQGLQTSGVLPAQTVAIAQAQLMGAAFRWWETYERGRAASSTPLSWHKFFVLFLEKFVPPTRRMELHRQFKKLRHEGMSVTQYDMRFSEVDHYAIWLVPTERERIRWVIDGLSYQLHFVMTRENASSARFNEVVDIARRLELVRSWEREEREAKRPRDSGSFSGVYFGGRSHHSRGHSFRPAQTACPVHHGASVSHGPYSAYSGHSSFSALPAQSSYHASSPQVSTSSSSGYQEQQLRQRRGCFECGDLSRLKRDCPRLLSGVPRYSSWPMIPAPAATPPSYPARCGAQAARGHPRGGGRSGGGQA
ncbi:uncharacterized protein [Nicotiana tomentosiformis]|uniref:uncharacterized protein n=1 Tax=Nicotiana tomentosiformis TaxID=4098 RepID=UPI00388C94F2